MDKLLDKIMEGISEVWILSNVKDSSNLWKKSPIVLTVNGFDQGFNIIVIKIFDKNIVVLHSYIIL